MGDNLKDKVLTEEEKKALKQKILTLCIYTSEVNEFVDYNFIIEVIDLLKMFNTKYKFESLFKIPHDLRLIFNYIRALYQQNFWKLKELLKDLKEIEDLFNLVIFKDRRPDIFSHPHSLFPSTSVYYGAQVFHYINFSLICCENLMQHTAVLSQLKNNKKALEQVVCCSNFFREIFLSLTNVMHSVIQVGPQNVKNFQFSSIDSFHRCLRYLHFVKGIDFPTFEGFEGKGFILNS